MAALLLDKHDLSAAYVYQSVSKHIVQLCFLRVHQLKPPMFSTL